MANANGFITNVLLLTEAVMEETENLYESPLSSETANVNETKPAAAAADWLLLTTLPLTSDPDVSDRVAETEGVALSKFSPSELRRDIEILGLTVELPEAYW